MARILIVEDEPTNAELASLICRAAKHQVTVVGNGIEALLLLDAVTFDLVITDVIMPRMDGITMTGLIRASDAAYANIPIIGMTARADQASQKAMREVGMDEVVLKPFKSETFRKALEKWADQGPHRVAIFRPVEQSDRLDA